jgi:hypothetical protein
VALLIEEATPLNRPTQKQTPRRTTKRIKQHEQNTRTCIGLLQRKELVVFVCFYYFVCMMCVFVCVVDCDLSSCLFCLFFTGCSRLNRPDATVQLRGLFLRTAVLPGEKTTHKESEKHYTHRRNKANGTNLKIPGSNTK